jgi:uncharacterized protein (TIGR04255 family)
MSDITPKFDAPPLVETALGLEFEPLQDFEVPAFGLFWNRIRNKYPNSSVQPPLQSKIESFDKSQAVFSLSFSQIPEVRCWFIDETETWLLQVQKTRFISNWRSVKANQITYPHYENVRARFFEEWQQFADFLRDEGLEIPQVLQCEINYVNHIEAEPYFSNLHKIFPSLSGIKASGFLPLPEALLVNLKYLIPDNRGRLYLQMQPVLRHADLREVLQLTLTAKVLPKSSDIIDIIEAFDLGREWAVKGFTDFTSEEMHKRWKRRQ